MSDSKGVFKILDSLIEFFSDHSIISAVFSAIIIMILFYFRKPILKKLFAKKEKAVGRDNISNINNVKVNKGIINQVSGDQHNIHCK